MRALLVLGIIKDDLERFEVGVNVCDDRVSHAASLLPNNFKSTKFIFDGFPPRFFLPDKMSQSRVPNRLLKLFKLDSFSFCHQLHSSILQIAHDACEIEPVSHPFGGRPEPHTLHMS
jgi:hypothetical protein